MTRVASWIVPPDSWKAVAWAPKALPKSRMPAPRMDGVRMGRATLRQYWAGVAPRFSAASRHSLRSPSMAGAMTRTMSGNWKYRYTIDRPAIEYSEKPVSWMRNPKMSWMSLVTRPRLPRVKMKARASGMPAKLLATPEKVMSAERMPEGRPPRMTAAARSSPNRAPRMAVMSDSWMLLRKAIAQQSPVSPK